MGTHWLMKSEPEPRVVQGVDVSFSADTFEKAKVTSWEGVRNYQARQFLRDEMKVGHEVLFYHSNTKLPGIAALAEVCRDGYPDPTAWDSKHPYYDAKATDKANPRWFRVDVRFVRRLPYFVPLALLQHIAQGLSAEQRKDVAYLSDEHLAGIAGMALLNRSRLSVQPVQTSAYEAVCLLGDHGNFSTWPGKWNEDGAKRRRAEANTPTKRAKMNQDTRAPNAAPPPSDAAPRTRRARRSP
ncbi:uncharacterized protein MJAP1_003519 [Malassezia japonica]|uniref:EVE domain-containing protein n=1 Tax=Malassezia japonica TaxID=223818 RepID=A0AAF0F0J2_9BASI|nr:uncharacterized protein MJAP1_003519 [Malassezia japonica]WFD40533.1 hypothetical protein MJAP1_003519 [Malassezia japonica]